MVDSAAPLAGLRVLDISSFIAAPAAAGVLGHTRDLVEALVAFVAFCLAASGTYLLNDAADVESDRRHPTKRFRPIAAGELSVSTARAAGVAMLLAGVGVGFVTGWRLPVVVVTYVALTTSYSLWGKRVPVLDLGMVAAGFVLRTVAGAVAVDVPISVWFYIVASFGSLFVVAGKRHSEMVELGAAGEQVRSTLGAYSESFLGYVRSVATGVTMVAYCLWAFEKSAGTAGFPWYEASIVPFVLAFLRYAFIVDRGEAGAGLPTHGRERAPKAHQPALENDDVGAVVGPGVPRLQGAVGADGRLGIARKDAVVEIHLRGVGRADAIEVVTCNRALGDGVRTALERECGVRIVREEAVAHA